MKILVIGDLHGHMPKMHFKGFDAIIAPGDFCSSEKIWKIFKKTYVKFLKNPDEYEEWYNTIDKSKAKRLVKKSLSDGRRILQKLDSLGVPVYIIPGNWDWKDKDDGWEYLNKDYYKDYLIKGLKNIHDCHKRVIRLGDCVIIGYGLVNGPELLKHRDYKNISQNRYKKNMIAYKKKMKAYEKLFRRSNRPKIILSHNVPFNTRLDKIVNKDSPRNGYHYGSNLVRDLILKHKPLLCIAGHMHEHYGTCKLGKTIILNAGFGGDKNTLIELVDGKIKSIKFYGKKC